MRRLALPALTLSFLACHRPAKGAPRAAPGESLTFIASDAPPVLRVAQPEGERVSEALIEAGAPGTLLLPVTSPAARPAPRSPGPDLEAVAELATSLTPEARGFAPSATTLPFYEIALQLDPEAGKLSAQVGLDYPNSTGGALAELPLRLFANAGASPARLQVAGWQSPGRTIVRVPASDPTLIRLRLDPPLPAGAWLKLAYTVEGTVPTPSAQVGGPLAAALQTEPARAPDYGLFARFPGGIALADWLPMVAARFEGTFDVGSPCAVGDTAFADVADFRAAIDLPADYRLAAPGALLGEDRLPGRVTRTRLVLAAGRDLTLFASKRFRVADAREGATRVRVIYEEGHAAQGQQVLTAARRALAGLSDHLTPYPWTQFTAVEVPLGGGAGGAEFSGLVAIAGMFFHPQLDLGYGLGFSGPYLNELREFTVTHEVAHQWWAIQVGSHPRLEPDVDESLTQATAAILLTPQGGPRDRKQLFDRQVAVNYQAMRLLQGEDGPAARGTADFETSAVYAGLIYGKAPLFYERLATELGDESFWTSLRSYAETHRFGLARRGDVLDAFAEKLPRTRLDASFTHWFAEAHGDTDLAGRGDPQAAAGEMFGGDPAARADDSDPDPEALMKAARKALSAAAAGQGDPQSGEKPVVDSQTAKQLLQQLDQTMGGADVPESP